MKPITFGIFALMILAATPAWCPAAAAAADASDNRQGLEKALQDLNKDLDGISRSAMELLAQQKDEFREKLEGYREQLDRQMDSLEEKIGKLSGESKEKVAQHIEALKEKNRQLTETAQSVLTKATAAFSARLSRTIAVLKKNITQLREQVRKMSAGTRQKLAAQIPKLRRKNQQIMQQLSDLKAKGFRSWKEIKEGIYDLWQDLRQSYDQRLDTSRLQRT